MANQKIRFALRCALVFSTLTGCDAPESTTARPPKEQPPIVDEALPPGKVTGVVADQDGSMVLLTWAAAEGADSYEIYRQVRMLTAPAMHRAPSGSMVGRSSTPGYGDRIDGDNVELTYRIVAVNEAGKGPASEPSIISFRRFPGWVGAGEEWGPDDPFLDDWSNVPATHGGNAGAADNTPLPYAPGDFTACATTRFAVTTVRPALATTIGDEAQTFSAAITYSTNTPDPLAPEYRVGIRAYTYSLAEMDYRPLYREYGYMLDGCNQIDLTFTALPEDVDDFVVVTYGWEWKFNEWDWWPGESQTFTYVKQSGSWFRLVSTTPAWGAELTGGTVSATIEYKDLARMPLKVALDNRERYEAYASMTTIVEGTGQFAVTLPYDPGCGSENVNLVLYGGQPGSLQPRVPFTMPSSELFAVPLSAKAVKLAPFRSGPTLSFSALSCTGAVSPVTISVDAGLAIGYETSCDWYDCYYTSPELNRTTSEWASYYLDVGDAFIGAKGYGTFVSNITVQFGALTITRPVEIQIYDYFFKKPPPATSLDAQAYFVEVTALNSTAPFVDIYQEAYNGYKRFKTRMWWNTGLSSYAADVTYTACGTYWNTLSDTMGYYSLQGWGLNTSTEVLSSPYFSFWWLDDTHVYLTGAALKDSMTVAFGEACDKVFRWRVVAAPPWVRFPSLQGSSADGIAFGAVAGEALATQDYAEGYIWIESLDHPGQLKRISLWVAR